MINYCIFAPNLSIYDDEHVPIFPEQLVPRKEYYSKVSKVDSSTFYYETYFYVYERLGLGMYVNIYLYLSTY